MIPRTSFGLNIMAPMWNTAFNIKSITVILDCFEAKFSKGTVQHALDASTDHILESISDKILESYGSSECVKIDELSYSIEGKNVYASTYVGDTGVTVMLATSRGMAVLESHFSHMFNKPITREWIPQTGQRMLRVIYRKIRQKFVNAESMSGFGIRIS